jgi:hypothetical protein
MIVTIRSVSRKQFTEQARPRLMGLEGRFVA